MMKRYLEILFNRQLVGKWAKGKMLKVALAAIMTMGVGMFANNAEAYNYNTHKTEATDYIALAGLKSNPNPGTGLNDPEGYHEVDVKVVNKTNGKTETVKYYVRNGWSITVETSTRQLPTEANGFKGDETARYARSNAGGTNGGSYVPKNYLVSVYKSASWATDPTFATSDVINRGTQQRTVLNDALNSAIAAGFVGAVNTGSLDMGSGYAYVIQMSDNNWYDVNHLGKKLAGFTYVAKQETSGPNKGQWYITKDNQKVYVEGSIVYNIDGTYRVFKKADKEGNVVGDGIYRGAVYGNNNELVKSTALPAGDIVTVWGTERVDADGEYSNLTVHQVDLVTDTLFGNDQVLSKADIKDVTAVTEGNTTTYTLNYNDGKTKVSTTIVDTDTQLESTTQKGQGKVVNTYTVKEKNTAAKTTIGTLQDTNTPYSADGVNVTVEQDSTLNKVDTKLIEGKYIHIDEEGKINVTLKNGDYIHIDEDGTISADKVEFIEGQNIEIKDDNTIDKKDDNYTYQRTVAEGSGKVVNSYTIKEFITPDAEGTAIGTFVDNDTKLIAGDNIEINEETGEITKTDTILQAGNHIIIEDNKISLDFKAGDNIQIVNGKIIKTNTTYESGDNIVKIENGVISKRDTKYFLTQMEDGTGLILNLLNADGTMTPQDSVNFIKGQYMDIDNAKGGGITWSANLEAIEAELGNNTNTQYKVEAVKKADNVATVNFNKKDLDEEDFSKQSSFDVAGDTNIKVDAADGSINLSLNADLSVKKINATTINVGETVIEKNLIDMGDTKITDKDITVGTTTIKEKEITTKNTNVKEIQLGDTQINEEKYLKLVKDSKAHTTLVAGDNITFNDNDPQIGEDGSRTYTVNTEDVINVTKVNSTTVNTKELALGDTVIKENLIDMGATQITDKKITVNKVITDEVDLGNNVILNQDYILALDKRVTDNKDEITRINQYITDHEAGWSQDTITTLDTAGFLDHEVTTDANGNYHYIIKINQSEFDAVDQNTTYELGAGVPVKDEDGNVIKGATEYILYSKGGEGEEDTPAGSFIDTNTTNESITSVLEGATLTTTITDSDGNEVSGSQDLSSLATTQENVNARNIENINNIIEKTGAQNDSLYNKMNNSIKKVGARAAAITALHPMDFDPDDKLTFAAGYGNYRGEHAASFGAFYRPDEKMMFSVAGTVDGNNNMVNANVSFALDPQPHVTNSKAAMAMEILELREQICELRGMALQLANKNQNVPMFPDVPENHWAYDYVEGLQKAGIIEGYPNGNFDGDRSCTRYEFAAMLFRALKAGRIVPEQLLKEFEPEMGRFRVDRVKGKDADKHKIERVRVNTGEDYAGRDVYGSKVALDAAK